VERVSFGRSPLGGGEKPSNGLVPLDGGAVPPSPSEDTRSLVPVGSEKAEKSVVVELPADSSDNIRSR